MKKSTGPAAVRVFPMPVAPFADVPHKVMDVTPEEAERLTAPISRHGPTSRFVSDAALLPPGYAPPDPDGLTTQPQGAADAVAPDLSED